MGLGEGGKRVNGERRREGSMIKIGRGGSEWREGEGGGKRTGVKVISYITSVTLLQRCAVNDNAVLVEMDLVGSLYPFSSRY